MINTVSRRCRANTFVFYADLFRRWRKINVRPERNNNIFRTCLGYRIIIM